jgi:hypothetical protein
VAQDSIVVDRFLAHGSYLAWQWREKGRDETRQQETTAWQDRQSAVELPVHSYKQNFSKRG